MFNWLTQMFGNEPTNALINVAPRSAGWTTQDELNQAKQYDRAYGDPSAGFFQPGAKVRMPRDFTEMRRAFDNDTIGKIGLQSIDQNMSDRLYSAWVAAQSSPTAALGYDPHKLVTAPAAVTQGKTLNIGGAYTPSTDQLFTTGQYDSTLVHESIHRGIQKLKEADMLPESVKKVKEEILTRALMHKYYGPVEKGRGETGDEQVDTAIKSYAKPEYAKILQDLETAASQLYYKQRPRGPR